MARKAGSKNRNYPSLKLKESLRVARAIEDDASGMPVGRLSMAELIDTTPQSSVFRELVSSSRFYGLTTGGINSDEFALTELGKAAVGADEDATIKAMKSAVMNVPPYKTFFDAFSGKKVPAPGPLKDFLVKSAEVDAEKVDEFISYMLEDAKTAGLIRDMKGSDYVDLAGVPAQVVTPESATIEPTVAAQEYPQETPEETLDETPGEQRGMGGTARRSDRAGGTPKKVFIAHGKNRTPLEQLKKALDQFKVKYAVAVDEANRGRPISKKVAELMELECSSGIFIFTADERFLREDPDGGTVEVWRPSENVVYELGAASILYDNRIVIFKEKDVTFPSDFSDLGYIEFEKDQLVAEIGNLFGELVALDILEVRAKG